MKITKQQLKQIIKEELDNISEVQAGAPEGVKISDLISYLQGVQGTHGDLVIDHPGLDKINRPPKPPSGKDHDAYRAWQNPHNDPSNYERSSVEDWFNLDVFSDGTVKFKPAKWKWLNWNLGGMSGGRFLR
jgi:hypothetical protein